MVTSLLTLYVMVLVWSKGFWRDRKDAPEGELVDAQPSPLVDVTDTITLKERADVGRLPFGMVASTATLIVASLSVTVLAGPISGVTGRAAESAQDVNIYRTAVLGDRADNPGRTVDQQRLDDGTDSLDQRKHELPEPAPGIVESRAPESPTERITRETPTMSGVTTEPIPLPAPTEEVSR